MKVAIVAFVAAIRYVNVKARFHWYVAWIVGVALGHAQPVPLTLQTYPPGGAWPHDTLFLNDSSEAAGRIRSYLARRYWQKGWVEAWARWRCDSERCVAEVFPGRFVALNIPWDPTAGRRVLADSVAAYIGRGHVLAAARWRYVGRVGDTLHMTPTVEAGPLFRWDTLWVPTQVVRRRVLERMVGFVPGAPYSPRTVDSVLHALRAVEWLETAAPPRTLFTYRKAHLYLPLRMRRRGWVDALVGFEGGGGRPFRLTGRAEMQLMNLFRRAAEAYLLFERSGDFQRMEGRLELPYVAATPWGVVGTVRSRRVDSVYVAQEGEVQLGYHWSLRRRVAVGGRTSSYAWLAFDSPAVVKRWATATIRWEGLLDPWDRPMRGVEVEAAMRRAGPTPAWWARASAEWRHRLSPSWTVALTGRGGFVRDSPLTAADAFPLGGWQTLPGFRPNQLTAHQFAVLSVDVERAWEATFALGLKAYLAGVVLFPSLQPIRPHGGGIYLHYRQARAQYSIGYFAARRRSAGITVVQALLHVRLQYFL